MAEYDLPAALTYVNNLTGSKIHFVGHSQGTLIMFIALAQKYKNVQKNILSFSALGPYTYKIKNQNY